jgi:hypothetical protein
LRVKWGGRRERQRQPKAKYLFHGANIGG